MARRKPPVEDETLDLEEEPRTAGLMGRLTSRLFLLSVVVGALVVAAPSIVSMLGLTDTLVGPWVPKGARLRVGPSNLAWWSPITLEQIHFRTDDESLDIHVEKVTTSASLLELALQPRSWGTVLLESPVVVAKVIAKPVQESTDSAASPDPAQAIETIDQTLAHVRGTIETRGGKINVDDGLGGIWSMQNVEGKVNVSPDSDTLMTLDLAGSMGQGDRSKVKGEMQVSRAKKATGQLSATEFPLGMLNPLLAWNGDGVRLGGSLTGKADFAYDLEASRLQIKAEQKMRDLVIASPALEPDRLTLSVIDGRLSMVAVGSTIQIEESEFQGDLGRASASGSIDWSKLSDPAGQNLTVEGMVDLPTLADRLPHLVRIREGVAVESGKISISLRPAADAPGHWDGVAEIREFRARGQGGPIAWDKPVSLTGRAGLDGEGRAVVDQFVCESDFLRAKGAGSLANFDVSAVCDLSRLQDRLGELMDLGDTKLAGRFSGRVQSTRNAAGGIALRGAAKAEELQVRVAGETLLAEPQLQAQFQLTSADQSLSKIVEGALVVKNEREHFNAHLVEAVTDWKEGSWGTWDVQASGDLAELVRRAESVSTMFAQSKLAGVGVVSGRFQFAPNVTRFEKLVVDVQGLAYNSPTVKVADKRVRLETSGSFQGEDLAVQLGPTAIIGQSAQFRTDKLQGKLTDDGFALACQAAVAADLSAVRQWTLPAGVPVDLAGQWEGNIGLESDGKRWATTVQGAINDFRYGAGETPTIDEPKVELAGRASSDAAQQGLSLQDFRVTVPGLAVTASGQMSELSAQQVVELTGWIDYDWQTLSPRLRGLLGDQIVFEGRDRRAFRLHGPVAANSKVEFAAAQERLVGGYPGLQGEFSLGWERARVYGFAAGAANIDGRLADSWVVTKPVSFPMNQGKVELRPGLFFGTQATYLHHPAGRLADRVQLTREMCEGALQYIAPVLADSVEVKGLVSVDVEEVKVPLGHLEQADFAGSIRLEDAQATGSPLLRELLVLTEGQPVVEIDKESEIRFRVRQGRVYHEGLRLRLPGMVIETSGFVGLDRSLEMTAEMPIPPRWFPNERVREKLAGQRIRVPIGGTLDKPRLDKQGFQRQVAELVQESAGRLIEGEINKQIDKQLGRFLDKLK
jgi:translocation and assembly module TamB